MRQCAPRLLLCCMLFALASFSYAETQTDTEIRETAPITWSEPAFTLDRAQLHKRFTPKLSQPLHNLLTEEILLAKPLDLEVSARPFGFFDPEVRKIIVPLANLYRVFDDLKVRFPRQEEVRDAIFESTMQFYFLSELIRAIAIDLELRISGWEAERIDALATIFMLESDAVEQAYLLDAAEEFLLVDRAVASIQVQRFKTQFEADAYRLNKILCVIRAYDTNTDEADEYLGQDCSGEYLGAMEFWSEILAEHLREDARLRKWRHQYRPQPEAGS